MRNAGDILAGFMKVSATIILLLFVTFFAKAQATFKAVAPQKALVAGEAFQVQYILEGGDKSSVIQTPVFTGFRLISGPNVYPGTSGKKPIKNFVYTLEALSPGTYVLPYAQVVAGGILLRSNEVRVQVITGEDAIQLRDKKGNLLSSEYFLRPGEDAYKKIRENLFLKVQVDKRSCYTGEPVQAIFKLYSRLQSKSDIVKNPGFYGFTVYDMINLADNEVATENVNGRLFDVHTIRKVQLYPLQPGRFVIDPMEVKNRVEFSRSAVNKKTEQQIAEGVFGGEEDVPVAEGIDVFESSASTVPVEVEVKPLPEKAKPEVFNGAVGKFKINALVRNDQLARNEQGYFEIIIKGTGNFTQLTAPSVNWPAGIEGFEPSVYDELNKNTAPLSGQRTFRFPFVCTSPGTFIIPAVSFSFYNRDSNSYRVINSSAIKVKVSNESKKAEVPASEGMSVAEQNERAARKAGLIAVVAVMLILGYWLFIRKEKKEEIVKKEEKPVWPSADELLQPAYTATADDKAFYRALQSVVWTFAAQRFGLSGSEMNKQVLSGKMNQVTGGTQLSGQLMQVLEICEAGIFTHAYMEESRENLLQQAKEIFEKTDRALL